MPLQTREIKLLRSLPKLKKAKQEWFTWGLAEIYAALGDNDMAIQWIEEAYKLRHDFIPWLRVNPQYKNLLDDPRVKEIIIKLDLLNDSLYKRFLLSIFL